MSRKLKNILMVGLVILLIVTSVFTMYHIKNYNNTSSEFGMQSSGGTPPEIPSGSMTNSSNNMEEPPEKPDGEMENNANTNEPPEMPSNASNGMMNSPNSMSSMNNQKSTTSISIGYYLLFGIYSLGVALIIMYLFMSGFNKKTFKATFKSGDKFTIYILSVLIVTTILAVAQISTVKSLVLENPSNSMNGNPNGFGSTNSNVSYSGEKEITETTEITSGEYTSTKSDENAILVTGDIDTTLENITVTKTGDSDGGDNTSFYGINSAIIAKSGASLTLKNIVVTTEAVGANGVFSYGGRATTNNSSSDGTIVTISDSTITTAKDNSGGIMTTGGGTLNASNLIINTSGVSSAAIRTDRGGGTVTVDGGEYTTTGAGSPSVYSTADITVNNATLVAKVSEGIVIEGKNSVTINNCDLTDSNTKLNGLSTTYKNIFLYQSMSGDADTGTAEFTANDSTITTNNGDSFYITNTSATINLSNNTIINNDSSGNFLRAKADSWGNSGSNGGNVTLVLTNQNAVGNIVIDSISKLNMTMKTNSYYEGKINTDNTSNSVTLTLDETSKIKLTGDSYISSLDNELTDNSNIEFNGYKLYVNGVAIN